MHPLHGSGPMPSLREFQTAPPAGGITLREIDRAGRDLLGWLRGGTPRSPRWARVVRDSFRPVVGQGVRHG